MNRTQQQLDRIRRLTPEQRNWLVEQLRGRASHDPGPRRGELAAWIVSDGATANDQELRRKLKPLLTGRLIPRRFILVNEIPRTSTGKIDRQRLHRIEQDRRDHPTDSPVQATSQRVTDSEARIIAICGELLGTNVISKDDNFFDIGGDSLLSIQMISRAREAGLEIEPKDVLQCESLRELAAVSDQRSRSNRGIHVDEKPRSSADQNLGRSEPSGVISKIRSSSQPGSILLIHEVGGRCHYAHYLTANLSPTHRLYITEQPAAERSPKTIEALAKLYAEAWLNLEPDGPKAVVSFCWGGLLAYELAIQLERRGATVDRLAIVESGTEAAYQHATWHHRRLDRMKGNLVRCRNRLAGLGRPGAVRDLAETIMAKLVSRESQPVTADSGFQFRDDEGDPQQIRQNVQAFLDYQIRPSETSLDLFRVDGPPGLIGRQYCDRSLGWRYLVKNRLQIHSIAGTHDTCMRPPHVEDLADKISQVINADPAFAGERHNGQHET